ncbi:hypothetical protein XBJ2_1250041 [Xenorhabdus bovienii str. Jollieti]|uniref:Uncharacterized protein n=1 Tax=Xenorhabdus bovienii (strain SS-2004) TaxID=406818 RepID=D3V1B8_XENBS|nr:hypothetical protein XBJ1_2336 [Xenorhabdus bovienii SS-2004]CDH27243.1 hypothetical protein XBJ2_1250041 [Xenorhabdus bovienii str. Jollieti]
MLLLTTTSNQLYDLPLILSIEKYERCFSPLISQILLSKTVDHQPTRIQFTQPH